MTPEELKAEAKKQGYTLQKIPAFHCSCYLPYPNELHGFKNGKCKCDNYYPIKYKQRSLYDPVTHCRKKGTQKSMMHELKILPEYYEEVKAGNKTFEVRKNDRDYMKNDTLRLKAWDGEKYLDKPPLERRITYILDNFPDALKEGYVILGLGG
jgi:hypothetical protein